MSFIDLAGEITLSDNEMEFRMLNKNGVVYSICFHSVDRFSIDGTFCANPGYRKIKRSSFDWLFALFLIAFAVRSGLGYRINTEKPV